ncbi:MAG: FGGY family carbohydrate kinase, partial [Proteobacteria bacterium]|nr:FGGY family carbohydrate kinase [Pseudomonadota bacterium]
MNAESYYIGLDVSTQGAKLLVLDYEQRSVIFSKSLNYDKDLPQYQTLDGHRQNAGPGVSESDPRMWLEAVDRLFLALQNAGVNTQAVRAIAVAGQQHGLVCLDRHGALTRNFAKLWNDTSTEQECEELTAAIGGPEAMIAAVGHVQKPGFTASKILHFKKEDPAAFARTSTFLLVHNYINYYLSGGVKAMEPGDASGTALMQPDDHSWCRRLTDFIDPQLIDKLPPITPSNKFIGSISPRLASKYGLREDCLIDAGSGDNMFGAIGSGNIQEGVVTVSLGTSGTAYALSEKPCRSADGELASFCDATGRYLPLVCVANLANGYNQFLEQQQLSHEDFEELIKHSPAGNQGRVLIPWFAGERTPNLPHASPVFFGFGLADFTQAFLARALLEGHVLNLYEASLSLPIKPNVIHLTGGLAR